MTSNSIQSIILSKIQEVYPNAAVKKIDKDNFLDILPSNIDNKKDCLFLNTKNESAIKIGLTSSNKDIVNKLILTDPNLFVISSTGLKCTKACSVDEAIAIALDVIQIGYSNNASPNQKQKAAEPVVEPGTSVNSISEKHTNRAIEKPSPDANSKYVDNEGTVFEGKWDNGLLVQGKFTTKEGKVAEGGFKNMELHGQGKLAFSEIIAADPEDPESTDMESITVMKGEWNEGQMVSGKIIIDDELYEEGSFDENGDLHGKGKRIHDEEEYEEGIFEHGDLQQGKVKLLDEEGNLYEGEFSNGGRNGEGNLTTEEGDVYTGFFTNNHFDGEGKLTMPNGDWKRGVFVNGEFTEGRVQIIYEDGSSYKGGMNEGQFDGRGIYTFASGAVYEGEFITGNFTGKGQYTYADGDFKEGTWANDDFIEGQVKITSANHVYEGSMKHDAFHGKGRLLYTNGDIYEGKFMDNEFYGEGKLTRADGNYKEGMFNDGEFYSGKVLLKYNGGSSYQGEMLSGEYHGKGKYDDGEGNWYEGSWSYDDREGNGKQQLVNGDYKDGKWSNDKFVSGDVRKTEKDGSWYEGGWDQGRPDSLGTWENPNTGEFKRNGMWDNDGCYICPEAKILVDGKLTEIEDFFSFILENAWAKEEEKRRLEEEKAAAERAEAEAQRKKLAQQREREEAAASKERERIEKQQERANKVAEKEQEKAARIEEAEQKKADAEREKNKARTFQINYKIKLTKSKSTTHLKGSEFGIIGVVFNGGKTKEVKTHDKGETIERNIRVKHIGKNMPNNLAKHFIEENDNDVKSGNAGSSTIFILSIKEVN